MNFFQPTLIVLDIDLKTSLTATDAAAEARSWLKENNRKCTWYQSKQDTGVLNGNAM